MNMSSITVCLVWFVMLVTGNSQYYTGSLGEQVQLKSLFFDDLSICVIKTPGVSVLQTYDSLYFCAKNLFFNCLLRKNTNYSTKRWLRGRYCGSIWMHEKGRTPSTKKIVVQLNDDYYIHFSILHFNFPVSRYESCSHNNMVLLSSRFKSEAYCGFRVPWTLVIKESRVFLHLSLSSLKPYGVELFYTGVHLNWISNIHQVNTLLMLSNFVSTIDVMRSSYMTHTSILQHTYCLMANPSRHFEIHIAYVYLSHSKVILHDGPGRLSNIIFDSKDGTHLQDAMITSTGNSIFLRIQQFHFSYFRFHIISSNLYRFPICKTSLMNGIFTITSSKLFSLACIHQLIGYKIINIKSFEFYGPNMLIDSPKSVCQYGGLLVYFSKGNWESLCDNVLNFAIYSTHKTIFLIFVSFSGYSHGHLKAGIFSTRCPTTYIELLSPRSLFQMNLTKGCAHLICPPSINGLPKCVVKLGPPQLGPAEIRIRQKKTLSSCSPRYNDITSNEKMTTIMKSVIVDNWPFDLKSTIPWTNFTGKATYDYLYSTYLKIPRFCNNSRLQLTVFVKISTCYLAEIGEFLYNAVNDIQVLTDECFNTEFVFKSDIYNKKRNDKKHDFYYKDSGDVNTGNIIVVNYKTCPMECRHYKYSTFVRQIDGRTVVEYTANVGTRTYTGDFHRGFRVSMLIPNTTSERQLDCTLRLYLQESFRNATNSGVNNSGKVVIRPKK